MAIFIAFSVSRWLCPANPIMPARRTIGSPYSRLYLTLSFRSFVQECIEIAEKTKADAMKLFEHEMEK